MTPPAPLIWTPQGAPRSRRFDDVYFSADGGLAEARAVFLEGCGLPDAWAGRSCFTVGELGFGTGLNVLALIELWRRTRPADGRLCIFSVEAFPISREDARRALGLWPELDDLAEALLARWPRRASGFHRIDLPVPGVTLDLAVMDAGAALDAWHGRADAWFLDGFSPAKNPEMWSEAVLAGLARRSAPGARLATFTVAGAVRRGLQAQGFKVEKKPGFGAKRERLEARLASTPRRPARPPSAAIVGAGIAGAALVRAFGDAGVSPLVIEMAGAGAGASGNPAALVMPRLDAGSGPIGGLYAQALARAADLYDATGGAVLSRGAVQLETGPKDAGRFDRVARTALFEAGAVERLAAADLASRLGEPLVCGGLFLRDARVVDPAALLKAWLAEADLVSASVAAIGPDGAGWRLIDRQGREIGAADVVCLAAGMGCQALAPELGLAPLRGQASFAPGVTGPPAVIGAGYALATTDGVLFGATHDRGDKADDVRLEDHARNLDLLERTLPGLAARLAAAPLQGRAGLRAVTPDFLPLAGPVAARAGLFVLSGLGSRGFCAAPLLADHIAALALGRPSPLPIALAALTDPARFAQRERRRGRSTDVQLASATISSRA